MNQWLRVRRWREYQHYTDRNPPWIKWHVKTLEDEVLNALRTETRLFWSQIVLVAAKKENVIPGDSAWLATEVSMPKRAVTRGVNELVQAGLLQDFDSKSACIDADTSARNGARVSRVARQRTETEEPSLVRTVVRSLEPDSPSTPPEEIEDLPSELPSWEARPF